VQKDKLSITVDEYLSIFMFIIVKSRVCDLEAHLYIVETFVDEFSLY
jgi:Vacuolar sorting protein 9 (VPS9) domain